MSKIKVLNLFAGIGGNRRLLDDFFEVTAVELNEDIAKSYQLLYPNDKVIVGDAMAYLLEHYREYKIIWASPPCPSHSRVRFPVAKSEKVLHQKPIYPEMSLYQIIIFLKHYFDGYWIVENVKPFYDYLIQPSVILHRHPFWTNFDVNDRAFEDERKHKNINASSVVYGCDLRENKIISDKRAVLRNQVNPEVGLYLIELAAKKVNDSFVTTTVEKNLFDFEVQDA